MTGKTQIVGLRLLVCGGRNYGQRDKVFNLLDWIKLEWGVSHLIHGAARGADELAADWAEYRRVPCEAFAADWNAGRSAGPIRNARMLAEGKPDLVVAFPGGAGTADMVRQARIAGIKVMEIPR